MPGKIKALCPMLTAMSGEVEMCRRSECEWWRGNQSEGICAVSDIAGWIRDLHILASSQGTQEFSGKKNKEEEGEEKPLNNAQKRRAERAERAEKTKAKNVSEDVPIQIIKHTKIDEDSKRLIIEDDDDDAIEDDDYDNGE